MWGDNGLLTYDWKHFPWEDYDEFLWGKAGPFSASVEMRHPDFVFISVGLHTCYHAYFKKPFNEDLISSHKYDIYKLLRGIQTRLKGHRIKKPTVVFITGGRLYNLFNKDATMQTKVDECILRFNRDVSRAVHEFGFIVLEVIVL